MVGGVLDALEKQVAAEASSEVTQIIEGGHQVKELLNIEMSMMKEPGDGLP